MSNLEKKFNTANIIAIAGFALLIVIAIWSATQLVKYAPRALEGISFGDIISSESEINMNLPRAIFESDDELKVEWTLSSIQGGSISFMYACADGVVMDVFDKNSGRYITLPCNTPYNISPEKEGSVKIKIRSQNKQDISLPIAMVYVDKNSKKVKDVVDIIIKKSAESVYTNSINSADQSYNQDLDTSTQNTQNDTESNDGKESTILNNANDTNRTQGNTQRSEVANNQCVSKKFGTPDLKVFNVRIGSVASNGYFIEKSTFAQLEPVVIKFYVSNAGDKTTPSWYFNITSNSSVRYTSSAQPRISPCSGRIYTINLQNIPADLSWIKINVDPSNLIHEKSESNNSAIKYIQVY